MPESPMDESRRFKFRDAVTLIVVLGTIVVILILCRPKLESARCGSSCANNLHQIGMAMSSYAGDYNECFPCIRSSSMAEAMAPGEGTRSMALLYPGYIDNSKAFSCWSKSSNYRNFEITGFSALPNDDPRLTWSTSYWYDYRHRDGQLSTVVLAGDAASDAGWSPSASAGYYRPVSHGRSGGNFMFVGARCQWIGCVPGGTAMAGDTVTDPNVYTRNQTQAQHDTCLVN